MELVDFLYIQYVMNQFYYYALRLLIWRYVFMHKIDGKCDIYDVCCYSPRLIKMCCIY